MKSIDQNNKDEDVSLYTLSSYLTFVVLNNAFHIIDSPIYFKCIKKSPLYILYNNNNLFLNELSKNINCFWVHKFGYWLMMVLDFSILRCNDDYLYLNDFLFLLLSLSLRNLNINMISRHSTNQLNSIVKR